MAEPQEEEEAVINDIQAVKVSQCRASLPIVSSSSSCSHFSPSVLMQLITDRHIILSPSGNRSSLGIQPSTTLLSVLHLGGSCTQRITWPDIWSKPSEPFLLLLRCSLETLRVLIQQEPLLCCFSSFSCCEELDEEPRCFCSFDFSPGCWEGQQDGPHLHLSPLHGSNVDPAQRR